jgi:pimeloyl-ACP methyl ester carboxylesterase
MKRRRDQLAFDDALLDVIVDGDDNDLTIVLLPSSLRDSQDFDELAVLLAAAGFQVLRPQPRGMGRSSPPPEGMTLETLADDVARVITCLARGPVVVVGHAYGHWIARVTDIRHPQLVRGVVLLGAAAREFPPGMAEALAIASNPQCGEEERLQALRLCMFASTNDPRPWLQGWYPQWRTAYRNAAQQPPRHHWYELGNAPMLDLQGAEDPWRPADTRQELVHALGAKVTVHVIANASHALVPEQPIEIARVIAAWAGQLYNSNPCAN